MRGVVIHRGQCQTRLHDEPRDARAALCWRPHRRTASGACEAELPRATEPDQPQHRPEGGLRGDGERARGLSRASCRMPSEGASGCGATRSEAQRCRRCQMSRTQAVFLLDFAPRLVYRTALDQGNMATIVSESCISMPGYISTRMTSACSKGVRLPPRGIEPQTGMSVHPPPPPPGGQGSHRSSEAHRSVHRVRDNGATGEMHIPSDYVVAQSGIHRKPPEEYRMQGFTSPGQAQRFLLVYGKPGQHILVLPRFW
jgi:hypothetical protein